MPSCRDLAEGGQSKKKLRLALPIADWGGETPLRQPAGRRRYDLTLSPPEDEELGEIPWSRFRIRFGSAAVLGGCRAGVSPAHPNPFPLFQLRLLRILRDIANRAFEFTFRSGRDGHSTPCARRFPVYLESDLQISP